MIQANHLSKNYGPTRALKDVAADRSLDIVLRLRAVDPAGGTLARGAWKAALRAEADALLEQLARRLRGAEER